MEAKSGMMGDFRYGPTEPIVVVVVFGLLGAGMLYVTVVTMVDAAANRTPIPGLGYVIFGFGLLFCGGCCLYCSFLRRNALVRTSESGILYRNCWGRNVSVNWEQIVGLRVRLINNSYDWWLQYRADADEALQCFVIPWANALDADYTALLDTVVGRAGLTGPVRSDFPWGGAWRRTAPGMEAGRAPTGEFRYRSGLHIMPPVALGLLALMGVCFAFIVTVDPAMTRVVLLPAVRYPGSGLVAVGSAGLLGHWLRMRTRAMLCVSESGVLYRGLWGPGVSVRWEEIVELREEFPVLGRGMRWRLQYRQEPDGASKSLVIPSIDDLDTDNIALRDAMVQRANLTGPERAGRAGWGWTR